MMKDGFEDFNIDYNERQTDISSVFKEIGNMYSNRNVGAIIIATDGLYNKGINPRYGSLKNQYPVYTIIMGDTSLRKDLILAKVNYNRIAYQGNLFPIEVVVTANKLKGSRTRLDIYKKGERVFSKNIDITGDNFIETVSPELDAQENGLQRYHLTLTTIEGEITTKNNVYDIFIDVLNARQKILILAGAPHPDITAIKQAIETNYNYEVNQFMVDGFIEDVSDYDLVILHQVPTVNKSLSNLLSNIDKAELPVLYILGPRTKMITFNQLKSGLSIISRNPGYNESFPQLSEDFTLFQLDDETKKMIMQFPPVTTPFGEYSSPASASVLFYQKIGNVETDLPLILFKRDLETKTAVIAGEGIWRWRLADYAKNENHFAFNEIILKMVQYMTVKEDRSFFRIRSNNRFFENEAIEFDAEVYNKSYELINDPEVELTITNEEDAGFPFVFGKRGNAYRLDAGLFPPGNYAYDARVKVGTEVYYKSGEFTVEPLNVEQINSVADHNLLYNLAVMHDGEMLTPEQLEDIPAILKARGDIKSVIYSQKRFNELNNLFWVLGVVILLLGVEWFLRKYHGAY